MSKLYPATYPTRTDRINAYHERLSNSYTISRQAVERAVLKFEENLDANPIGGPETFVRDWMREEP